MRQCVEQRLGLLQIVKQQEQGGALLSSLAELAVALFPVPQMAAIGFRYSTWTKTNTKGFSDEGWQIKSMI
jgi:hypothetical protein